MVTGNHTPVLLTLYGKHLDDHWGLLLWKRGQNLMWDNLVAPGGIGGRSGASALRADFPDRFFCYAST